MLRGRAVSHVFFFADLGLHSQIYSVGLCQECDPLIFTFQKSVSIIFQTSSSALCQGVVGRPERQQVSVSEAQVQILSPPLINKRSSSSLVVILCLALYSRWKNKYIIVTTNVGMESQGSLPASCWSFSFLLWTSTVSRGCRSHG